MWYGIMNLCRQAGIYLAIYIHLVAFRDLLNWEIKECTLSIRLSYIIRHYELHIPS